MRLNLFRLDQYTVPGAKPNYDFRNAQEERLDPVLHEFAMEIVHVTGGSNFRRRFEFYPVYGLAWFGFGVPYCSVVLD